MKHSRLGTGLICVCAGALACSAAPERMSDLGEAGVTPLEAAESSRVEARDASAPSQKRFTAAGRRHREYTDARWYFTSDTDIDAWYAVTQKLEADFDDLCGDTFCEGDYSNYRSLGIRCSVETRAGSVGLCVWTFAGSQDEVVPSTGNVNVSTETWTCKLPVSRDTPVRELVKALSASAEGPLRARLPGSEATIYDGLVSCL